MLWRRIETLLRVHRKAAVLHECEGAGTAAYDPRGSYGMALAYGTSSRGGCHLRAYPISQEILRKPVATDRFSFDGKARLIKVCEDVNAVVDSLSVCKFAFLGASIEEYAHALAAATGRNIRPGTFQGRRADRLSGASVQQRERLLGKGRPPSGAFLYRGGIVGRGIEVPAIDRERYRKS